MIRAVTTAVVVLLAAVAAVVSYRHAFEVVTAYGEAGFTAYLVPLTIDGAIFASSMVMLDCARRGLPVPPLARWTLGLGILATLAANVAHGWAHGPVGAIVAAWPAVALVLSYELLMGLIRRGATVGVSPMVAEDASTTRVTRGVAEAVAVPAESVTGDTVDSAGITEGTEPGTAPAEITPAEPVAVPAEPEPDPAAERAVADLAAFRRRVHDLLPPPAPLGGFAPDPVPGPVPGQLIRPHAVLAENGGPRRFEVRETLPIEDITPVPDPVPEVPALHLDAARVFADDVAAGTVPSLRQIKTTLRIGQPKAKQVQAYLAGVTA
ncbi:DUF2637 domain-containing protein [Planomonospora sp. ID82291]|uniref:DUF2637 domain-containing protein n=1 Tax=Planomonospora sp. ID82291 TaxID=2738136 RepID=UPI0027DCFDAB|nr:DUF2637 domain-containing protein [Planomonospora sp. ID82291]